jgi:phosphatidylinositol alpha-1,6-mannosyltransferase
LLTYGNDYLAAQYRWHRNFFNYILSKAAPLITISQNNAEILRDLVSRNPAIVYPGTDPTKFFPVDNKKDHPIVLLSVGRLIPRKGMDLVLEALPKVLKQCPDMIYKIVGDGPDRSRLEQLSLELGVDEAVDFLGYAENGDLPSIYQSADIFVLPSREMKDESSIEGFGIVYLEASACGLPVIAGRSGGAVEAVIEGETGILVDPYDSEILGEAIIYLIDDPDRRARMGMAGREWVVREMNWVRAASEIYKLLEGN